MRKSMLTALLTAALCFRAWNGFCGSPYAANGIGDVIADDYGRSRGMGGAGAANGDGMSVLRDNPALIGRFDSFSFAFGALYTHVNGTISVEGDKTYGRTVPNLIQVVLPLSKYCVVGWGLSPYSQTDTNLRLSSSTDGIDITDDVFTRGGISVSTTTIAGSFRDIVSFGYSMNYYFGMIEEDWKRSFPENDNLKDSVYYLKRKYRGYGNTFGILARIYDGVTVGAGYTMKTEMKQNTYAAVNLQTNPERLIGSSAPFLPSSVRLGVYSRLGERMQAGMDLSFIQWEDAARNTREKEMYNDTYRLGGGLRFIPSTRTNAPYLATMPLSVGFRFGTYYYKSYYKSDYNSYPVSDTVFEKAVTIGIELPFKKNLGSIVTSFEYGTRGDASKNGWDETIMSFGIAVTGKIK